MSALRSQDMSLYQLMISRDNSWDIMNELLGNDFLKKVNVMFQSSGYAKKLPQMAQGTSLGLKSFQVEVGKQAISLATWCG